MPFSSPLVRLSLFALLIVAIGDAGAIGLGEMRVRSYLGEPFVGEIELVAADGRALDASCFRLRPPAGDGELPWLKNGSFGLRPGSPRVLEVRSWQSQSEPVLQIGIDVACGQELRRDYTVFLSPRDNQPEASDIVASPLARAQPAVPPRKVARAAPAETAGRSSPRLAARGESRRPPASPVDRLLLSGGGDAGEPGLRLATELAPGQEEGAGIEAQRDVLRLEYRLLAAMQEQASSQLAAADKLRNMESILGELQARTGSLAEQAGKDAAAAANPPPAAPPQKQPAADEGLSEWGFYGLLAGMLAGIGAWLGWRQYRRRAAAEEYVEEPEFVAAETPAPPPGERAAQDFPAVAAATARSSGAVAEPLRGALDLLLDERAPDQPMQLDVPLDAGAPPLPEAVEETPPEAEAEHSEVNPVMELADIMLSFGRVKGAAQALQEYIDQNPDEALQPWIRLMDVYRMAGMRDEFERLARELNRYFNVEVQLWEPEPAVAAEVPPLDFVLDLDGADTALASPMLAKKASIEQLEHICRKLTEVWDTPDCHAYLHQLLRDNRGGQRNGFPLPVVEEILFLVDLLEVRRRMAREEDEAAGASPL